MHASTARACVRPPSGFRIESQKSARPNVLESGEEHVYQSSAPEDASSQIPHLVAVRDAIALTEGSRNASTFSKCNKENVNCIFHQLGNAIMHG